MTVLLAFTDLYLFLSKRDAVDNINSCSFVRLGIPLVLGFEDCLIFRAAELISQQTVFFYYWTTNTLYGGASAGQEAGCQLLEAYSGSQSPENGQEMHNCLQRFGSCLLSCLVRPMTLEHARYSPCCLYRERT